MHRHEIDDILASYHTPLVGDSAVFLGDTEEIADRSSAMAGADAHEAALSQELSCDDIGCWYPRCAERAYIDAYETAASFYEGLPPSEIVRRWDQHKVESEGAL